MFEVTRAPSESRKVRVAIFRGTGRERVVVFGAEPVLFGQLPPELEEELTSDKPRLTVKQIPNERRKVAPPPVAPVAAATTEEDL